MTWLKGIITAVIVTLLTTVALAAFQRPIANFFAPDKLEGTMEVAPWYPLHEDAGEKENPLAGQKIGMFEAADFLNTNYLFARLTVRNGSPKKINEIRIRQKGPFTSFAVISDGDNPTYNAIGEKRTIELPDLSPGQSVKVYLWRYGGFDNWGTSVDFDTYSSEGAWRLEVLAPVSYWRTLEMSRLEHMFLEYGDDLIFGLLLSLVLLLIVAGAKHNIYWKDLLSDEGFYRAERARFKDDPTNFKFRWSGLGDFWGEFWRQKRRSEIEISGLALPSAGAKEKSDEPFCLTEGGRVAKQVN